MFEKIQDWLKSVDTGNILHDLAATQAQLANAISKFVQEGKAQIQNVSDQISDINSLSDLLRTKRASGAATADGPLGPAFGDAYNRIYNLLKAYGGKDIDLTEATPPSAQT